ncbi:Arginase family protein [Chishuiella changwenlii]|uniref:Arginase n=1 Tax=Chishuiella changwenlii TaxID=1434701 RepID=A0A1M6WD01_9FLAO|nr:arginase family protein [Chishuiella changwenlii]GGF05247.1 arginase [Chishuiella changwenlii]SHK91375.1 Arginase family protein [Chishuiella changwenlii]
MYKDFLKPVSEELQDFAKSCNSFSLGASIKFQEDILEENANKDKIALIGVTESRSKQNDLIEDVDFSLIRTQLYELQLGNWTIDLYDFGDINYDDNKKETEKVFREVINGLVSDGYVVIILGGTPSLGYQQYRAYDGIIDKLYYLTVDSKLRLDKDQDQTTDENYLTKVISHEPFNLLDYTNIGYQTYFVAQEQLDLINQLNFETIRLGQIADNVKEVESYSRDVNAALINLSSLQGSDFSSSKNMTPNGFSSREICALTKYLGFSNKVSSIYVCDYIENYKKLDHLLISQMIWYFIEGKNHRPEIKSFDDAQYFDKIYVPTEGYNYIFYRNAETNQWWIEVDYTVDDKSKKEIISCSEKDYEQALKGEVPNRWWKYFKKFY